MRMRRMRRKRLWAACSTFPMLPPRRRARRRAPSRGRRRLRERARRRVRLRVRLCARRRGPRPPRPRSASSCLRPLRARRSSICRGSRQTSGGGGRPSAGRNWRVGGRARHVGRRVGVPSPSRPTGRCLRPARARRPPPRPSSTCRRTRPCRRRCARSGVARARRPWPRGQATCLSAPTGSTRAGEAQHFPVPMRTARSESCCPCLQR